MSKTPIPTGTFEIPVRYDAPVHAGGIDKAVANIVCNILSIGYPAPYGQNRVQSDNATLQNTTGKYTTREALQKYGSDLFDFIGNVMTEVVWSGQDAMVHVHWDDTGRPKCNVIDRYKIDGKKIERN